MKKKRSLLGITLLASATLLVACQSKPNSTTSVEKSSTKTSSSKTDDNTLSEEKRKRNLTKFYEEFPADQAARYQGTIDERSKKAWNNDQPNIFAGQASLKIHDDYLEHDELKRLEVKIDGYDESTRRLKLTVTNHYDTTLRGTRFSNNLYDYGTYFTLRSYSTTSGRAGNINIMQLALADDLEAGKSITLEVLPKYYQDRELGFKNPKLDSKYYLLSTDYSAELWDKTANEQVSEDFLLSNQANIYIVPKLTFDKFPSTAPSDKELKEILSKN